MNLPSIFSTLLLFACAEPYQTKYENSPTEIEVQDLQDSGEFDESSDMDT